MHEGYKDWLQHYGVIDKHLDTQLSQLRKVEKSYGDLYEYFKKGTYEEKILNTLEYSKDDERENKPNPSKIRLGDVVIRTNLQSYKKAARKYFKFLKEQNIETYNEYLNILNSDIKQSLNDSSKDIDKRLKTAAKKPNKRTVTITVYDRNSDVIAKTLTRANGICEECNKPAPFIRKTNNTPYLEVHHKIMLADGGDDTVKNAMALCPNCHREKHHG